MEKKIEFRILELHEFEAHQQAQILDLAQRIFSAKLANPGPNSYEYAKKSINAAILFQMEWDERMRKEF